MYVLKKDFKIHVISNSFNFLILVVLSYFK